MRWRWPWATREDEVIGLLDEAIAAAEATRAETSELTESARQDVRRRLRHLQEGDT